MKKKAVGPVGAIFLFIFFNIVWFIALAPMVSDAGQDAINNGATGLEAFFYANLNFIIFIAELLGVMGFIYLGSGA